MRDSTRLILQALTEIAITVFKEVLILVLPEIINWFIDWADSIGEHDLAFTLRQEINGGQYTVVQGIFDQRTDTVKKARRIRAERLDAQVQQVHARNGLAIYT
jgi:hypothetical protein